MRFGVPQFIEVEDKIVGPFTWRQFVYIAGGAGILVTLWFVLDNFILFALLGLPIGALAASLAFQRVNSRPFSIFLEALITYFTKNKLYLWRKEEAQVIRSEETQETFIPDTQKFVGRGAIHMLARKLDGEGTQTHEHTH